MSFLLGATHAGRLLHFPTPAFSVFSETSCIDIVEYDTDGMIPTPESRSRMLSHACLDSTSRSEMHWSQEEVSVR